MKRFFKFNFFIFLNFLKKNLVDFKSITIHKTKNTSQNKQIRKRCAQPSQLEKTMRKKFKKQTVKKLLSTNT